MDRIEDSTQRARTAMIAGTRTTPSCWASCWWPRRQERDRAHIPAAEHSGRLGAGGGVAVFLAGDLIFRQIMRIGRPWYRLACTAGALLAVPVGRVLGVGQLAVVTAVLTVLLSVEGYRASCSTSM
jgi:hypothetical protein